MLKKKPITLDDDMEGKIKYFMDNKNKITEKIFDTPTPKKKPVPKPAPKPKPKKTKKKNN